MKVGKINTSPNIDSLVVRHVTRIGYATGHQGLYIDGFAVVGRLTVEDCATLGGATGVQLAGLNACTITHAVFNRNRVQAAAGTGVMVQHINAVTLVTHLTFNDCHLDGNSRFLDTNTAALGSVLFQGCRAGASTVEFARLQSTTGTTDVTLLGNRADALSAAGMIKLNTTQAVIVRGSGNSIPAGKTVVYAAATPASVRLIGADLQVDLSMAGIVKTAGDLASNTNGALACGAGPAVSNGTNWKGLYSGATY